MRFKFFLGLGETGAGCLGWDAAEKEILGPVKSPAPLMFFNP